MTNNKICKEAKRRQHQLIYAWGVTITLALVSSADPIVYLIEHARTAKDTLDGVIFLLSTLVPFSAILSFIVWRVIDTMVYKLITAVKKEGIEQLDDFKKLRKEYRVKYYSVVITIILILQIPSTIEVFLRWYYWV